VIAVVVAASVVLALVALLVRPVKVHAQVKAKAGAEGAWSAAAGGAVGPLAFTAGISPRGSAWTAHLLGRAIARGTRIPGGDAARRAGARVRRSAATRALGVARTVLRRVRFERFDALVRGTAGDPATTARVLGLLTAASAALAPRARIASDVDWLGDSPFVDVDCDLEASFVPLLLGWDVARATLSHRTP
jgi:hypothetical protein